MSRLFDAFDRHRYWNAEESLILDQVRRAAKNVIAPAAAAVDRDAAFPNDSMAALNKLGANAIFVPEAYGGAGQSYPLYLEVVRIIAGACAATGITYATNFHAAAPIIDFGDEEQKRRFLPRIAEGGLGAIAITEPHAGSDALAMRTAFTEKGDEVVIDGDKCFITSGDVAGTLLLFGKWAGIEQENAALTVAVIERPNPGIEVMRIEDKMGHRGSSTAALAFSNCRIPRSNVLGRPGDGLKILRAALNRSRPSTAAHALGIGRAALEDMESYMNARVQSGRRVIDNQANQFLLADLAAELAMAEKWLHYVSALAEAGEDVALEASIAKLRASDIAMRLAIDAVQMHGGYGYCRDMRVERLMRDAKVTQIWEGTNQVHRQLIGRSFISK
ncbi:MAG: acyl-CoA dehydrogenase family protein [Hyphomonadaceae bacterium]|nr:acyl-CoA dehydrogenase family protein [Hyphomonadaceae bacterium]